MVEALKSKQKVYPLIKVIESNFVISKVIQIPIKITINTVREAKMNYQN